MFIFLETIVFYIELKGPVGNISDSMTCNVLCAHHFVLADLVPLPWELVW